jgi:hypothetical protein
MRCKCDNDATSNSQGIIMQRNYSTNYIYAFLFIKYLTKHLKTINNMRFINLIMLYDFIQVLNIKRRLSTKDEHFSKHILFTMIYFLTRQ